MCVVTSSGTIEGRVVVIDRVRVRRKFCRCESVSLLTTGFLNGVELGLR
jgi:plastocyanin domain-containing protein